ncbi:MAG: aminopeptidase P family protein [Nitrososphaeria archaeon]|jgi:Xaa-Pro aminopeptidase/Xaa-Pro dipeptidase
MKDYTTGRRKRILSKAEKAGANCVLASSPENMFYFTNFWGGSYVLISEEGCLLFTGALEAFRALSTAVEAKVISVPVGSSILSSIKNHVQKGSKILSEDVMFTQKEIFEKKLEVKLEPSSKPFYELRRSKDEREVASIEETSKLLDQLYEETLEIVREGITEREIASKVIGKGVEVGLDMSSGLEPVIVATGPNSAYPHAQITDRKLKKGDVILADYFFRYKAYVSDETRTFVFGKATKEIKEAYEIVHLAQLQGIKALKPGSITGKVDAACRGIINDSRFSEYYTHGTGHGVGLEVHEPPTLSINQKDKLVRGDIVTIEPGIYFQDKFGIRIEDTVYVGEELKVLTRFAKDLIEI